MMTYEEFNTSCGALPATTYVMQWGGSHVWKVGGKVFAIGGLDNASTARFIFKTSEQNYYFLSAMEDYRPAPYFASRGMKWIQYYGANLSHKIHADLQYYINQSHCLVAAGLSQKKQRELGLLL